MTMKKQLLFKTLALVAALTCALGASAYDFVQDNIYYTVGSGYTAKVTYKSEYGGDYHGDVVIPSVVTHNGVTYTVTSIGEYAFRSCHDLTSVKLPPTLMFINDRAFYYCISLTSIDIPEGVESIGVFAFYNNEELTSVTLPSTLTSLGGSCFGICGKLTSVTCWATTPPAITYSTFYNISTDCKLHVPSSAVDTYKNNSDWKSAFNSVVSISYDFKEDGIFYKYWTGDDVYVWYEDESSWDPCYYEESYVIPETVTHDGIIHQVTGTGPYVFYNCTNLKEITLPATMKRVSYRTFQGCSALTTVRCLATNPPTTETEVFDYSTYSNATLYVPENAVNSYRVASTWKNFVNIRPILAPSYDSYLNIEGGTIHFTSEGDYPWILKEDGDRTYAQSGNAGVHSSSSTLTAVVTVEHSAYLSFDFITQGQDTQYTLNDICEFRIDGREIFALTDFYSDWSYESTMISPGTHTLTWTYKKDATINPPGDFFAIDNVALYSPYDDDLNSALNVEGGNIEFYSDGDYPWIAVQEGGRYYGMSGNKGVHSSQSEVWATVKVDQPSILTFDFMACGENYDGAPADVCIFMLNGTSRLYLGAYNLDWETYSIELNNIGTYTMRFIYGKDVSDNGEGDYFALDNVAITPKAYRGDVNGDGSVNIADVTTLIDYLLSGDATGINLTVSDCNLDYVVNIADVTHLIDYLLSGHW